MGRPDVTDKDPFANTEDAPRDNVGGLGFLFRSVIRYAIFYISWGVFAGIIMYLIKVVFL